MWKWHFSVRKTLTSDELWSADIHVWGCVETRSLPPANQNIWAFRIWKVYQICKFLQIRRWASTCSIEPGIVLDWCWLYFLRKICILGIAEYFLIVLFQISEIKKDEIRLKKYIFLLDMFLIVGGGGGGGGREGSSNRNASRDESVEAGDKSVEAGDESIIAGEKTPQSCYKQQ